MQPKITIGFPTRNDPGAWWTLNVFQSRNANWLSEDHEFLIVDNSPEGSGFADELRKHVRNSHKGQNIRIGADLGGPCQADEGIQVGAVHVDLAADGVDDLADLADAGLEHAVGRGIGHHERRQPVGVLFGLGAQILDVDIAQGVAAHHHHRHAGQHGAGGVGAVGGGGDQADVALRLPTGGVIGADDEQTCIFALAAGVGLQRHGVEAGDLGEPGLQVVEQLAVAAGLLGDTVSS